MVLIKFESTSMRVKGIAFHPTRPWILASQYSGLVELYNYRLGISMHKFDEHYGPVRGIDFHSTQPIFVTGGDDFKIKVWNYQLKKCMFTLLGHSDYVRTTFFHKCQPWIVSASDDQTIRIWNWQSRECIAVLAGHTHWVLCAQFHPAEELVASAGLDQTIRVWTISSLFKRNAPVGAGLSLRHSQALSQSDGGEGSFSKIHEVNIFGQPDGVAKHIIQAHDSGINWVSFHPTLPVLISSSDDRRMKLWRFDECKAWEVDSCRGHHAEVSCAIFHPRAPLILSASEDGSVRVWDVVKRTCLESFYHGSDKFWSLATHPTQQLFAAGHDSGMMVFKLERERPPFCVRKNHVLYIKGRQLRLLDFGKKKDVAIVQLKSHKLFQPYYSVQFGEDDGSFIVVTRPRNLEDSSYDTYKLGKKSKEGAVTVVDTKHHIGVGAVWLGGNRIAAVDKSRQLIIRDFDKAYGEKVELNTEGRILDIFAAGQDRVLLREVEMLHMCDVNGGQIIASVKVEEVRYVVWSKKGDFAALLGKRTLTIVDANLKILSTVNERVSVKSGAWDDDAGVFVFTTSSHLKYAMSSGDHGIIRTLDVPVYLLAIRGATAFCLDKSASPFEISFDSTEYRFKLALVNRCDGELEEMISSANLIGQSIIAYACKNGFAELALNHVKDKRVRFVLALECGNLQFKEALDSANVTNDPEMWKALAEAALVSGNLPLIEVAYSRIGDYDKLSFFYLITGNTEKLRKMMDNSVVKEHPMLMYQISLYLGDAREQVNVLASVEQPLFAYLTATTNSLDQEAAEMEKQLVSQQCALPQLDSQAKSFKPSKPVFHYSLESS